MTFTSDTDFVVASVNVHLKGATLLKAQLYKFRGGEERALLHFKTADGDKVHVFVNRDPEDNGPGFLDIRDTQGERLRP